MSLPIRQPVIVGRNFLFENIVTSASKKVVTFETENGSMTGDQSFVQWVNDAVGLIECKGNGRVVVRVASLSYRLPNGMSSLNISVISAVGSPAIRGQYYTRFGPYWFPQEAVVEAGVSEIPL